MNVNDEEYYDNNRIYHNVDESITLKNKEKKGFKKGMLLGIIVSLIVTLPVIGLLAAQVISISKVSGQSVVSKETTEKMRMVEDIIKSYYYKEEDIDIKRMEDGIYQGMISSLNDPYSVYYTEDELTDLQETTAGIYYGIGAYLSLDPTTSCARISGVISDTPAEEAGLRENDIIYQIDGETAQGLTLEEIVSRVKGEEGTQVHLTIYREGESDYLEIDVTRRKIESPTVSYEMYENGIGYIQITEFDDVTVDQFTDAYATIRGNQAKGLILDLRSNPGGNLSAVVAICQKILPEGLIVYTEDRNGNRTEYSSDGENQIDIPLVVLVNGYSASASEILAGAVKDYEIGTLVGTQTYGKGIVQRVIMLSDDTAMKLTVSDYYTPKGNNIHGIGIEPDVICEFEAEPYYENDYDNQLEKAKQILMEKMK